MKMVPATAADKPKKGAIVTATTDKMPANKPKAKSLPRVTIEGADNGGVIVTVDTGDRMAMMNTAPEKHVFASYADAESLIEAQFGGKA